MTTGLLLESPSSGDGANSRPSAGAHGHRRQHAGSDRRRELHVDIVPLPARDCLAAEWLTLEQQADASFFISWSWIGAWLRTLPPGPVLQLVRVTGPNTGKGHETVGLCIVADHVRSWRGVLSIRAMVLNATGNAELDRITIEHNDVLCHRQVGAEVRGLVIDALLERDRRWDELHLPGMMPERWQPLVPDRPQARIRSEACYAIDLAGMAADSGPEGDNTLDRYLAVLSSNTRAQIRRSIKAYEQLGPIRLVAASDAVVALQFLEGLRTLHQRYWNSRGEPGAFAHPFFERFHRELITAGLHRGEIQLLRLSVGDDVVGYLHNFVWRGRVMNYQSGFDYEFGGKQARPGLVVQALAVAYNADRGADIYDFMAGTNRSKESLSNVRYDMEWIVVRRERLKFRLDDALRRLNPAREEKR